VEAAVVLGKAKYGVSCDGEILLLYETTNPITFRAIAIPIVDYCFICNEKVSTGGNILLHLKRGFCFAGTSIQCGYSSNNRTSTRIHVSKSHDKKEIDKLKRRRLESWLGPMELPSRKNRKKDMHPRFCNSCKEIMRENAHACCKLFENQN
jgi:hypothetical protein